MTELRDLYQEVILDHGRKPRNFCELESASHHADGYNPLCGDRLTIYVETDGERVVKVGFQGSGCAISMASASMMSQELEGKSIAELEKLFEAFHDVVTGKTESQAASAQLGKLVVFAGVSGFPVRVKCATLPWHTLRAALADQPVTVSTE